MIRLVPVVKAYCYVELLYEILQERTGDPSINISHTEIPCFAEHKRYVMSEPYRYWYFGMLPDKTIVGIIYLTPDNDVGIQVRKEHQGRGYGKEILGRFLAEHQPAPAIPGSRPGKFVANINPNNEVSIKLFTGLGFRLIQQTYRLD